MVVDEASQINAYSGLSDDAKSVVDDVIQLLGVVETLEEAQLFLMSDMEISGNRFSIKIRGNYQHVVAGVLGKQDGNEILMIEVARYE